MVTSAKIRTIWNILCSLQQYLGGGTFSAPSSVTVRNSNKCKDQKNMKHFMFSPSNIWVGELFLHLHLSWFGMATSAKIRTIWNILCSLLQYLGGGTFSAPSSVMVRNGDDCKDQNTMKHFMFSPAISGWGNFFCTFICHGSEWQQVQRSEQYETFYVLSCNIWVGELFLHHHLSCFEMVMIAKIRTLWNILCSLPQYLGGGTFSAPSSVMVRNGNDCKDQNNMKHFMFSPAISGWGNFFCTFICHGSEW